MLTLFPVVVALFLIILHSFSGNLDKQTSVGNTVLHYCSMYGKPECLKLLLRSKPTVDIGECGRSRMFPRTETAHTSHLMFLASSDGILDN